MNITLFFILLVVGYCVLWLVIFHSLARISGWRALARLHSSSVAPAGERFGMCSISCGWIDYNGGLTILVTEQGLYLSIWPLFNTAHAPLLIPWSELHFVKMRRSRLQPRALLDVGAPALTRLGIPARVYEAARPWLVETPNNN